MVASLGACEICLAREAVRTCPLCGRNVCEEDWDKDTGTCTACAETLCRFCRERLAHSYCIFCGRMGCDRCLVQVDNVRWACRECLSRIGGREAALRVLRVERIHSLSHRSQGAG